MSPPSFRYTFDSEKGQFFETPIQHRETPPYSADPPPMPWSPRKDSDMLPEPRKDSNNLPQLLIDRHMSDKEVVTIENSVPETPPVPTSSGLSEHDAHSPSLSTYPPLPLSVVASNRTRAGESFWTKQEEDDEPPFQQEMRNGKKKSKRLLFLLCAAVVIAVVALGAGLGAGLGTKKHSSSHVISGVPGISTTGAFNYSGIALASESFGSGGYGTIVLYFQYHDGTIRNMQLSNGVWIGGDVSTIVANDAKNATPISAVAYAMDGVSVWHVFYVGTDNTIKQRTNTNATNLWVNGPLNNYQFQAMDDPHVGLQACWYGSQYGDATYNHSPVQGESSNYTAPDQSVGMHLWYGAASNQINEISWAWGPNNNNWTIEPSLAYNGHAGIGCYSWGPGSISYVMLVDHTNAVNLLWKDRNSTSTQWTNTSVSIQNAFQNTSLGYTNFFYVQGADLGIHGYNISWAAENTTLVAADDFSIQGDQALPGTHFSVTAIPDSSGGNSLLVFNQETGSDIVEWTRDLEAGQWSQLSLPVPV